MATGTIDIKDMDSLKKIAELGKLKRENPEEYKQFFDDLKVVFIDLHKLVEEILE